MDNNGDNGNGVERVQAVVLQLTFYPATFRLEVGGNCVNADVAMAMLDQAKRAYEHELRKLAAMRMQQELQEMAQNAQVAAALRKH